MSQSDVKCPKFRAGDWNEYVETFEAFALIKDWDDNKKLKALPFFLEDPALQVYKSLSDSQRGDWITMKSALTNIFMVEDDVEKKFMARRQEPGETFAMYAAALRVLGRKAFADHSDETREKLSLRQFLRGLDKQIAENIARQNPTILSAALADAEVAVKIQRTLTDIQDHNQNVNIASNGRLSVCTTENETRRELDNLKQMVESSAISVSEVTCVTGPSRGRSDGRRSSGTAVRWRSPTLEV